MVKFKYVHPEEEDLIEHAVDRLMRDEIVCGFTADDFLQDTKENVYNNAYNYYFSKHPSASDNNSALVAATIKATNEYTAYLQANPSAKYTILYDQVEDLLNRGEISLVEEDRDQQLSDYDDYCCGIADDQ